MASLVVERISVADKNALLELLEQRRAAAKKRAPKKREGATISPMSHPRLFELLDDDVRTHFTFNISIFEADRAEADVPRLSLPELRRKYQWI